jgi:hypothetical protein
MREFDRWTLDAIRAEGASMSWFEEQRFEWIPQIVNAMKQILLGKTIILVSDGERNWFAQYIIDSINKKIQERPMIPIIPFSALHRGNSLNNDGMNTFVDMLEVAFKGDYFFWYIGRGGDEWRADLVKRSDNGLIWIMDEHYPNSLALRSYEPMIDIRLLQLYRLFDHTLSAVLFGEIDVYT